MRDEFFGSCVCAERFGEIFLSLTDYAGGASIRWHRHDQPYMNFVLRGGYSERLTQRARDCRAESLVLHPAGEVHADDFRAPSRCLNIQADSAWLRRWNVAIDAPALLASPELTRIAARLARELRRNDALSLMVVEGLMLELGGDLGRDRASADAPPWLRRVREEIAARFREPLTTSALAAAAGVHPVHLARAFRRHFARTIGETVRELRVEFAKRAIRAGAPLTDVALDAGFADQSHLTRTFRTLTGTTPAAYRRAHGIPAG